MSQPIKDRRKARENSREQVVSHWLRKWWDQYGFVNQSQRVVKPNEIKQEFLLTIHENRYQYQVNQVRKANLQLPKLPILPSKIHRCDNDDQQHRNNNEHSLTVATL